MVQQIRIFVRSFHKWYFRVIEIELIDMEYTKGHYPRSTFEYVSRLLPQKKPYHLILRSVSTTVHWIHCLSFILHYMINVYNICSAIKCWLASRTFRLEFELMALETKQHVIWLQYIGLYLSNTAYSLLIEKISFYFIVIIKSDIWIISLYLALVYETSLTYTLSECFSIF